MYLCKRVWLIGLQKKAYNGVFMKNNFKKSAKHQVNIVNINRRAKNMFNLTSKLA